MEASEASTAICRHLPSHFFLDVKGTFGPGVMTLSACCLLQHMLACATSQATHGSLSFDSWLPCRKSVLWACDTSIEKMDTGVYCPVYTISKRS